MNADLCFDQGCNGCEKCVDDFIPFATGGVPSALDPPRRVGEVPLGQKMLTSEPANREKVLSLAEKLSAGIMCGSDYPNSNDELLRLQCSRVLRECATQPNPRASIMWTICRMALMVNPSEAMIHQVKRLAAASEGIAQQQLSVLALRAEQTQSKPHVIAGPASRLAWQGSYSCPKCGEAQSTAYAASEICSKCAIAAPQESQVKPHALNDELRAHMQVLCDENEKLIEALDATEKREDHARDLLREALDTLTGPQAINCIGMDWYERTVDLLGPQ